MIPAMGFTEHFLQALNELQPEPDRVLKIADSVEAFPQLEGKKLLSKGCYSDVYEGEQMGTVYKLTCDMAYVDFMRANPCTLGVPTLHNCYESKQKPGQMPVALVEIQRLTHLDKWDHEVMKVESEAVHSLLLYRVLKTEATTGKDGHVEALNYVADSGIFSTSVSSALRAIGRFMGTASHRLVLDLRNPDNFMTDGRQLFITDPFNVFN